MTIAFLLSYFSFQVRCFISLQNCIWKYIFLKIDRCFSRTYGMGIYYKQVCIFMQCSQLVMWGNGHLGWMRWWGRWKELQECGWVHGPCVNVIYERKLRSHVACFNNSFIWEMDHSDWGRTIPIMYMFHAIAFFLTTENNLRAMTCPISLKNEM